ncbi:hypothetical protein GCM10010191_04270 [Actinomadura vinacea]|uniref:Uncharacterized protein n=1 Tax=Actinomadura vinacea TaxID=115336 RepID=A0ABP5VDK6_9ACTN
MSDGLASERRPLGLAAVEFSGASGRTAPVSIVAALETGRTSWTAILDAVRLEPGADLAAVTTA